MADNENENQGQQTPPAAPAAGNVAGQNTTAAPTSPAPAQPEAPTTMEVPVDKMQALFKSMEDLTKRLDDKDREIAALNESVSAQRLSEARAKGDLDKRPRYHFKKLHGKVVIGWPETIGEDKINQWVFSPSNPTAPIGEILKCRYYLLDGTKTELIDQIELSRSTEQVFARAVEDLGNEVVVEFEDKSISSEPLKVHKKFLNA